MAERRKLEFFVLRYVPNAVREEFVNIGLVMIEPGENGGGFADVRFAKDWRRLHCLDPQADVEMLQALEREIRREVAEMRDRDAILKRLKDSFSNLIQISEMKGCATENPALEIETMAEMYLEGMKGERTRTVSGRQRILGSMRQAWELAGVAGLVNPVPVAAYTRAGDPFRFDFGYRVVGEFKLFHAVSLRASVDAALMLAARYQKIADGMMAKDSLAATLTAVVDDGLDRNESEIGFALGMMEENRIRVAAVQEMPRIAEQARMELRA